MSKTLTKAEWVEAVMRVMNETGWDDSYSGAFIGSDTTHAASYAADAFRSAWRMSHALLPKSYFLTKDITGVADIRHDITDGTGYALVPPDYYRLSSFRLKGWKSAVVEHTEMGDAVREVQSNEYTRGGVCRPVCVIGGRDASSGEARLYYYSLPKGMAAEVQEFRYIPLPDDIGASGSAEIDERMLPPLSYIAAAVIYTIFEKPDVAAELMKQVQPVA